MEVVKEEKGILGTIRAPRLEDAGLEDCALSPNSIKQAFLKAASSLRSLVTEKEDCIEDPVPTNSKSGDSLIGIGAVPKSPGKCENEKGGGLPEVLGDKVEPGAAENEEEGYDKLLGPELPDGDLKEGKGKKCIDGLQGLKIDEDDDGESEKDEDGEEGKEKAILVEAFL